MSGGERGAVVWLSGMPSAGKSTLGRALVRALRERGEAACLLDGDEVRRALVPQPAYDEPGRDAFYATLAQLAALVARQGLVAVVAATAHRKLYRERARDLAPSFVEVHVDATRDEVEARDSKGLYALSRSGELSAVPGADLLYEPPDAADVTVHGGREPGAVERILDALARARSS